MSSRFSTRLCRTRGSSAEPPSASCFSSRPGSSRSRPFEAWLQRAYPQPITRGTTSGRAVLSRDVVHVEDTWLDPEYSNPLLRDVIGLRSILTVPIFREADPIGAISVWRDEPRPFTDKQIVLLKTFADQAVIAIENVRLFKELEARTGELTKSVEK